MAVAKRRKRTAQNRAAKTRKTVDMKALKLKWFAKGFCTAGLVFVAVMLILA